MRALTGSWRQIRMRNKQTTTTNIHTPKQTGANKLVFKLCINGSKEKDTIKETNKFVLPYLFWVQRRLWSQNGMTGKYHFTKWDIQQT